MADMIMKFQVKVRLTIDVNDLDAIERTTDLIQAAIENGISEGRDDCTLTDSDDANTIVHEEGVTFLDLYHANGEVPS